jgi:hypothetical protein
MLKRIITKIERRRAQSFVENARGWYQACNDVSKVMGDVLHDPSIINKDIGYTIDSVDRLLLHLRYYIPDSLGILRRRNPELAQRFDKTSELVYRLRNETTKFLIRSQGPGPMTGDKPDEEARIIYYYRALNEAGFSARDLKKELDFELKSIWRDLQKVIIQEEMVANYQ